MVLPEELFIWTPTSLPTQDKVMLKSWVNTHNLTKQNSNGGKKGNRKVVTTSQLECCNIIKVHHDPPAYGHPKFSKQHISLGSTSGGLNWQQKSKHMSRDAQSLNRIKSIPKHAKCPCLPSTLIQMWPHFPPLPLTLLSNSQLSMGMTPSSLSPIKGVPKWPYSFPATKLLMPREWPNYTSTMSFSALDFPQK